MKRNPKLLLVIAMVFLLAITSFILLSCESNKPKENSTFIINYLSPSFGGYYTGGMGDNRYQRVKHGSDGEEVTVAAEEGYVFIEWSDGVKTMTRRETNVQSNMKLTPIFARIEINIRYYLSEGGRLEGETNQTINYGDDSAEVTAIAEEGYLFAGWSDGEMKETRFEKEVKEDFIVSSYFVRKT